jgi:hypothetical protein
MVIVTCVYIIVVTIVTTIILFIVNVAFGTFYIVVGARVLVLKTACCVG